MRVYITNHISEHFKTMPQKASQSYKIFFEFANTLCFFFKKNHFLLKIAQIYPKSAKMSAFFLQFGVIFHQNGSLDYIFVATGIRM